jgi:hypothetical protein
MDLPDDGATPHDAASEEPPPGTRGRLEGPPAFDLHLAMLQGFRETLIPQMEAALRAPSTVPDATFAFMWRQDGKVARGRLLSVRQRRTRVVYELELWPGYIVFVNATRVRPLAAYP